MGPTSQEPKTPATEPVQTNNQTDLTPLKPIGKSKRSKGVTFLSILFLLSLLGVGAMTYLWYDQKSQVESLQADVDSAKTTEKTLRAELASANKDDTDDQSATMSQDTDTDLIKKEVSARQHAQKFGADDKLTLSNVKIEAPFAKVSVAVEGSGGYACWLKKSEGMWVVMFCGQSLPLQEELDNWAMPANILQ